MTATTRTDQRPDVHEMVVVHRTFRREFPAIAGLIRATAEGDISRAKVVADHLRLCMAGLEMHHTGEDVVLWPLLLERAAPSTGLVETMQAQHHAVDAHVATIGPASTPGRPPRPPPPATTSPTLVERFTAGLVEHLDMEEREVLPLASRHLTAAEWDQMGEHGKNAMSASQLPIMFGLVLEDADDEERARMLAHLPAPIRVALKTVGAWQFRRYIRRVRAS